MARWNGRSRKQNKKTRDGYEPIETCPNCQADIFFSHEIKRYLEPRTRYLHSDVRCKTIQKARKVAQTEKNKKTLRPEVIQELKSEVLSFDPDTTTQVETIYEVMVKRKFEIDKVSKRELAVAFFPNDTYKNQTGETVPTHEGIAKMDSLLRRLRKHPHNHTTLVFSKRYLDGEWYYYNLQTEDQFQHVKERLEKQIDGLEDTLEKSKRILDQTKKQREKAEEEFRKTLDVERERRRKKRKSGGGQ